MNSSLMESFRVAGRKFSAWSYMLQKTMEFWALSDVDFFWQETELGWMQISAPSATQGK